MDDEYNDYGYEQQMDFPQQTQNIETTLQFENCRAQELLRENKFEQALQSFTQIYNLANQNNVPTWKAKALHQLLELHVQMKNVPEVQKTLHAIKQMNQTSKTNEQAVKNIIKTLGSMEREAYQSFWDDIFMLISGLDDLNSQLKCYFLMFDKQIQFKNQQKSTKIYDKITTIMQKVNDLPHSSQLQFSYLQILYLKLLNQSYSSKLQSLYIRLPLYQSDASVNDTYLSNIKQFIAPTLYSEQNYVQCSNLMCGSFMENIKYGTNNAKNKEMLKINTLMVLLTGDSNLIQDKQYNPMLQESTAVFKIQPDIQGLYGLIEAFKGQDIAQFQQILKIIKLDLPAKSPYADLQNRVLLELKKQKLASICRTYKTIKYDYIKRRINESSSKVIQQLLFSLITSNKINGVIHINEEYLEVLPEQNTYYTVQLQNLKDITQRM